MVLEGVAWDVVDWVFEEFLGSFGMVWDVLDDLGGFSGFCWIRVVWDGLGWLGVVWGCLGLFGVD